jgi:hypothetical protein
MDCIVSRISAMPLLRSTMAAVVCSGVRMTRGAAAAPIGSDDVDTIADVEENAGGGAAVVAGSSADEDAGKIEPEISDTRCYGRC